MGLFYRAQDRVLVRQAVRDAAAGAVDPDEPGDVRPHPALRHHQQQGEAILTMDKATSYRVFFLTGPPKKV